MKKLPLILLILFAVAACHHDTRVADTITAAGRMIDNTPDSARRILDALDMRSESQALQARHALFLTMAREKSGIIVTDDSLIRSAVDFYRGQGNSYEVKALYYLGVILGYKGDYSNSLVALMEAADRARHPYDDLYLAMAYREQADLYQRMIDHRKRIDLSRQAARYFDLEKRPADATRERIGIAYSLIALNHPDSALCMLADIEDIAANYPSLRADLLQTRALAMQNSGRHRDALNALKVKQQTGYPLTAYDHYLISLSYCALNKTDSARQFLDSLNNRMTCLADSLCMLRIKTLIESHDGKYKEALETQNQYFELNSNATDHLLTHPYTSLVSEYYHAKSNDDAAKYKIARQQAAIWSMTALLIVFFGILLTISAVIIIRYYRKNLQKKKLETEHILADMEQLREHLNELSATVSQSSADSRLSTLPATLLNTIFKKRLTIPPGENGYKTLGKIAVEFIDTFKSSEILDDLEHYVNMTNNQLMARFRRDVPDLSAGNYTIALLTFAGFSVESISGITKISEGGYRNARSRIRAKINSSESPDADEFLSYFPKIRG